MQDLMIMGLSEREIRFVLVAIALILPFAESIAERET